MASMQTIGSMGSTRTKEDMESKASMEFHGLECMDSMDSKGSIESIQRQAASQRIIQPATQHIRAEQEASSGQGLVSGSVSADKVVNTWGAGQEIYLWRSTKLWVDEGLQKYICV